MNLDEFKISVKEHAEKKLHWIQFAKILFNLRKSNELDELLQRSAFSRKKASEIIRAYNFLEIKFPKYLNNNLKATSAIIAYLPTLIMKMQKRQASSEQINEIVQQTILGEISEKAIIRIGEGNQKKVEENKIIEMQNSVASTFINELDKISNSAEEILNNQLEALKEIRMKNAEFCHQLARKLEAIANDEFSKIYKQREEITLWLPHN